MRKPTKHKKYKVNLNPGNENEITLVVALYAPITDQTLKSFHAFNKIIYDDIIKEYGEYLSREYLIKGNPEQPLVDYTYYIANYSADIVMNQLNDYLQKVDVLKNNVKFECQTSLSGETNS